MTENLEKIESLDKWRRIIAYNTLKQWQKRIRDKSSKRNDLLDHRQRELSKEAEQTNELIKEYYSKLT